MGTSSGRDRARCPLGGFVFAATILLAAVAFEDVAFAWGPSVHLWVGDAVLNAVVGVLPLVGALVRRHAPSFLYGTISPDFYVGKGSAGHEEHCHNWQAGRKLLEDARTDSERAFALGYLAHLAADVIGHNYFVPNHLYRAFGSKKLGHAYFELHADNVAGSGYRRLAKALVSAPQEENDRLLEALSFRGMIPLRAKKRIFATWIAFTSFSRTESLLERVRPYSEHVLRRDDVQEHIELSTALALETLRDPETSVAGRYDPIGAYNIRLAKELRRYTRRYRTFSKADLPFPVPSELRAFRRECEIVRELDFLLGALQARSLERDPEPGTILRSLLV